MIVLRKAALATHIKEQEYGVSGMIKFSYFDSCLGVASLLSNSEYIIGIHLVLFRAEDNNWIDQSDIGAIENVLLRHNYLKTSLSLFGNLTEWNAYVPNFMVLLKRLGTFPEVYNPTGSGYYMVNKKRGSLNIVKS